MAPEGGTEARDLELVAAVRAACEGDQGAYRLLYDRFRAWGLLLVRQRYGELASADEEDILQEAFVVAFAKLHGLEEATSFGKWFQTALLRVCMRRSRSVAAERDLIRGGRAAPPPPRLSDVAVRERRIAIVRDLIEAEIAERLDSARASVASVLYRFRRRIRLDLLTRLSELAQEARDGP